MTALAISSLSLSQSMRTSMARMQRDLGQAQKEASDLRVADVGLALGAGTTRSVALNRDLDRLNTIADTNTLAAARLSAAQDALGGIGKGAQSFLSTLTLSLESGTDASVLQTGAETMLASLTSLLNTSINGEYVFGGTNTSAAPVADWSADASPARQAFNDAFTDYFGFASSAPAAADISATDMNGFLDALAPQFLGDGWTTNWSNASDAAMTSRIALNETSETSVGANDAGLRKLAMAAAAVSALLSGSVGAEGRQALAQRAVSLTGEAVSGIAALQSRAGVLEKRVSDATERVTAQADLFESHIQELEGVDPYESSARVASLLQQIETSYALTARLQQLSLAQYLA